MRAKASKRLLNKDIARGFEAWQALYEEKRHAMAKLRASSNRLRTPALAAAWSFWAKDHAEALRQAKYDELVAQTQSVEAQLRQARYEAKQLAIVRVAQDDENRLLREQVSMLSGVRLQQSEAIASYADLPAELDRLKQAVATAEASAQEATAKRGEMEADVLRQLDESKALLARLLDEQKQRLLQNEEMRLAGYDKAASAAAAKLAKVQEAAEETERALREEIRRLKEEKAPKKKSGLIDLDESPGAPPYAEQIATALRENSTRVLDLFRSWDADGDGQVSRAEFHRAMPALGLDVPKKDIDELFSEWDVDGGGEIGYGELRKILSKRPAASSSGVAAPVKAIAALGKFKKLAGS